MAKKERKEREGEKEREASDVRVLFCVFITGVGWCEERARVYFFGFFLRCKRSIFARGTFY